MKLLIDLSILRHPFCGLGQLAIGYGEWYANHPESIPDGVELTLLVPKEWAGRFGDKVHYLVQRDAYRIMPWLMPRFDVWHSMHQLSPFRPASRSTRRIVTIHDVNFIYEKQGAKQQRYTRRLQWECDSATALCFISRFAQEDTGRHIDCKDKPQHVIYNGVGDMTAGDLRAVPSVADGKPFLLSIGVVKEKKNLHCLLPLMDLLPDYRLVIAGDDSGPYAALLRQQLPQHPNVSMLGIVDDAERRWLYANCTALLFPSLSEGFGLPVIEAMQWGKPVFCSKRTSLPEIGSTHASYFDTFEPGGMASTIADGLAAFNNEAAAAEQKYAATYSFENHMRRYWDLYQSV